MRSPAPGRSSPSTSRWHAGTRSAWTPRPVEGDGGHLHLLAAAQAVRRRRVVLVRRRRRRPRRHGRGRRVDRAGPGRPRRARHRRRLHHHDAPRHERPAAGPARRRRGAPALPRHGLRDGPGQGQGHRQRLLPGRRGGPGRQAAGDRAGQPRRLGRLRPRPARERPQGHRDLRDDDGRRRRLRARGHHPRGHLRRPRQAADDRRRPHVQPLQPRPSCTRSARSSSRGASGGRPASTATASGTSARATCAPRAGCTSAPTSTSTAGSCA